MSSTGVDGGAEGHGQGAGGAAPAIKQRRPKACDHWLKHGACQYGDKCHFSHSSVHAPTGSNTNDVRSDRRNDADKRSTGHNHGAPERRPHVAQELGASSNSKVCNHWLKHGSCRYGDKCHFRHSALPVSGKPMSNVDRNAHSRELHKPRADRRNQGRSRRAVHYVGRGIPPPRSFNVQLNMEQGPNFTFRPAAAWDTDTMWSIFWCVAGCHSVTQAEWQLAFFEGDSARDSEDAYIETRRAPRSDKGKKRNEIVNLTVTTLEGEGGGGFRLGSPSWWNQSWFYNPFLCLGWTYQV